MLLILCRVDTDPLVGCFPANCQALPGFVPYASGGDGDLTQYCMFLLLHPNLPRIDAKTHATYPLYGLVGYVGYDPKYFQAVVVGHQVSFSFDFQAMPLVFRLRDAKLCYKLSRAEADACYGQIGYRHIETIAYHHRRRVCAFTIIASSLPRRPDHC